MDSALLFASAVAGILTILAPCMVPVLPILLGSSLEQKDRYKPLIITASLVASIILFTLIVRIALGGGSGVSQDSLTSISGVIILLFGLFSLFPEVWDTISTKLKLATLSNQLLGKSSRAPGRVGQVLLGASLGPVFTSCSPTYAVILSLGISGDISLIQAALYLLIYGLGLGAMLLLIGYGGQAWVKKLRWAIDPDGWFKRLVAISFIVIGLAILTGFDKQFETWLLERGVYDPFAEFENKLR